MKAGEADTAASRPFAQVSVQVDLKCPQLPKLRAPAACRGSSNSQRRSRQKGAVVRGFQLSSTSPRASSNSWYM